MTSWDVLKVLAEHVYSVLRQALSSVGSELYLLPRCVVAPGFCEVVISYFLGFLPPFSTHESQRRRAEGFRSCAPPRHHH